METVDIQKIFSVSVAIIRWEKSGIRWKGHADHGGFVFKLVLRSRMEKYYMCVRMYRLYDSENNKR